MESNPIPSNDLLIDVLDRFRYHSGRFSPKIDLIACVREVTGGSLKDAKTVADNLAAALNGVKPDPRVLASVTTKAMNEGDLDYASKTFARWTNAVIGEHAADNRPTWADRAAAETNSY